MKSSFSDDNVVCEGAQGILLDQQYGVGDIGSRTWSDCTLANLAGLLAEFDVTNIGVHRPYMVRHGYGTLPTEVSTSRAEVLAGHNATNEWQGAVRFGYLDLFTLSRALDHAYGQIHGLALSHCDHNMIETAIMVPDTRAGSNRAQRHLYVPSGAYGYAVGAMEEHLSIPVVCLSHGPTHADKELVTG